MDQVRSSPAAPRASPRVALDQGDVVNQRSQWTETQPHQPQRMSRPRLAGVKEPPLTFNPGYMDAHARADHLCQYLYFSSLRETIKARSGIDLRAMDHITAYETMYAGAWQVLYGKVDLWQEHEYGGVGTYSIEDLDIDVTHDEWNEFLKVIHVAMPPEVPAQAYYWRALDYPDGLLSWRRSMDQHAAQQLQDN